MIENAIKGWVLSTIGLIGIVVTCLHWSGVWRLPNPEALSTSTECAISLITSFALFGLKKTKIDVLVEDFLQAVIDRFKSEKKDA